MQNELLFHGKKMQVLLSDQAQQQSLLLSVTLLIEIQIYFSCLLGKRLAFYSDQPLAGACQVATPAFSTLLDDSQRLTETLFVRFNTVMTANCPVADYDGPPPVTDFHIANKKPYVPDWLNIDYKKGVWCGEYGWASSDRANSNTRQVNSFSKKNK